MRLSRALVLALIVTALAAPARAEGETCRGQAATIVGEPHGSITGTPGNDVIVTNGAEVIVAGDGDDTVCVTATPRSYLAEVDAGPGADTVDTTATREYAKITLGTGSDEVDGGNGDHTVVTGPEDGVDTEYDAVHTLGGYDTVQSGQPGSPDPDDLDLGGGDGAIEVRSDRPMGVLRAAAGSPAVLRVAQLGAGRWVVDEAAEHLTLDGATYVAWKNLAMEYVDAVPEARIGYLGTARRDFFYLLGGTSDGVELRGGSDSFWLARNAQLRGTVSGGRGTDTAEVVAADSVRADLRDGDFSKDDVRAQLNGFENLKVYAALASEIHGTPGPNFLYSDACHSRIRAGEGDDDVYSGGSRGPRSQCRDRPVDIRMFGGPGDDYLKGGSVPERLYGGPGEDTASGGNSHDLCRAETRIGCEA